MSVSLRVTEVPYRTCVDADVDLRRFLSKIYKELGGCWIWTGAKRFWSRELHDGGYGAFFAGGRIHRAHKWIYEKLVGKLRHGQVLMHACDTRSCVNIWHLYAGTQKENVADMVQKGRHKGFGKEVS